MSRRCGIFHDSQQLAVACLLILLGAALGAAAQSASQERTYQVPKAEVDKALQALHANAGGPLPTLEGFVNPRQEFLDDYQRGYYQYRLVVTAVNATETKVQVNAKITAWHKAGYEVLPSNGRLESDLLDNLGDALRTKNAGAATPASSSARPAANIPDAPSSDRSGSSPLKDAVAPPPIPLPHAGGPSPAATQDSATEQRIRQLTEEGNSLREILRNQSRPSNLAVIKAAHTPILEKPLDGSPVVLMADAEDEFQIVDTAGEWVHVQVSGISRGWLRRWEVDVPGGNESSLSSLENDPRSFDRPPAFEQIREEVSVFPGKWEPLDGKKVKIIWVQPSGKKSFGPELKLNLVKSVLRKAYPEASSASPTVAGVVVILDSEDGGMAAATMAALQQWHAGHLPDGAFWKRCWLDPAEAFKEMQ